MFLKSLSFSFILAVILFSYIDLTPAFSEPMSQKAQAAYEGIMQLSREAMQSPKMTRSEFERRLSSIMTGTDDDQKAAKASAMVMFDTIEFVHENNEVESKFDYAQIFDGKRYKTKEDIVKQQQWLAQVNEITAKTIKNSEHTSSRLEEEFKNAKVSATRIQSEVAAIKSREIEVKDQTAHGLQRLKIKIALNEVRIKALDFLAMTFGQWEFKDNFVFKNKSQFAQFESLRAEVTKQEVAFAKFH